VLAERRSRSEEFFATAAGQWDRMRAELFGGRTELLPLLGLLDSDWRVADLGCGTGQFSQQLAPFVKQVIAVDASAAMLRSARTRLGGVDNVEIRRGELEALPIDDGSLDAAFLVLVLPYVAEPDQVIREAARALKPGGRLLVTDLMPHERAEYRQALGHQWQGFDEAQLLGWLSNAGLTSGRYRALAPEPSAKGPLLFTAAGRKPV
jgi:ArsR family transcriptional regulator